MGSPTRNSVIHAPNLNSVCLLSVLRCFLNITVRVSRAHSIRLRMLPKPMVSIIKKNMMHQIHGNGIKLKASG